MNNVGLSERVLPWRILISKARSKLASCALDPAGHCPHCTVFNLASTVMKATQLTAFASCNTVHGGYSKVQAVRDAMAGMRAGLLEDVRTQQQNVAFAEVHDGPSHSQDLRSFLTQQVRRLPQEQVFRGRSTSALALLSRTRWCKLLRARASKTDAFCNSRRRQWHAWQSE